MMSEVSAIAVAKVTGISKISAVTNSSVSRDKAVSIVNASHNSGSVSRIDLPNGVGVRVGISAGSRSQTS